MNRGALARFFGRVHYVRLTGCWVWLAAVDGAGYGVVPDADGRPQGAHVVSYEAFVGPVGEGQLIDHLCLHKRCVNPAHLEAVTAAENARRYQAIVTHCKNGHPRTPENVRRWKNNNAAGYSDYCVACRRERAGRRAG